MKLLYNCLFLFLFVHGCAGLNCLETREKHLTSLRIGTYTPQCDSRGNWLPKQCHASSGYCFCVDQFGNRLGAAVPPTSETILLCKHEEV